MCGIWGVFAKTNTGLFQKDLTIAEQMMVVTSLRGDHSTGLAITNYKKPKQKPRIWKCVGGPGFLTQNKVWEDVGKYFVQDGGCAFGHGRFATKGNITAKNAHPFSHKHITLVHNGTIHTGLNYKTEDGPDLEVDSHALCVDIAEKGIEVLKDITGAYAIIAHDQEENCIYIARNTDRPLYYAQEKDRIYLMSEERALEYVLKRNSIWDKVESVAPDKVWKFDLETYNLSMFKDISKTYVWPAYDDDYRGYQGYQSNHYSGTYSDTKHAYNDNKRTYYTAKKTVEFLVESIEKILDTEWVYTGITEDDKTVEFRTNQCLESLKGSVGSAEVSYEIYRNGKTIYFVKYREIQWAGAQLTTFNNKKIADADWKKIVAEQRCAVCDGDFDEKEVKKTLVQDNGAVVCPKCTEEFVKVKAA